MRNKIFICLVVIMSLFLLSACTKEDTKEKKNLKNYDCTRTSPGIDKTIMTITTIHLEENDQFADYQVSSEIDYRGDEANYLSAKSAANKSKGDLKESDKKGYTFTFKTNDEKMILTETRTYLKEALSDDLKEYLNKDGTFDLKGFKDYEAKKGFVCKF